MAFTTIDDSSAHFQTAIWTGDGASTRSITNDGNSDLQPDWVWLKNRTDTENHTLADTLRGVTKRLMSNNNAVEDTNGINSVQSDGFTAQLSYNGNTNAKNYVAWQWAAGGSTPTKTYKVVVVSDSGNKYRFRNSADTATFAQSAVTLELQQGGTYTFDQSDSTVASHPMKFSTTSNGTHGGGTSYNTGVTYNLDGASVTESAYVSGFASATTRSIILNVQNTTTLYYYCHYHSGMGGQADQNATFGSSNFDGSIQSRASTNSTAGFSIVRHTGTGSSGTIGHGLSTAPKWVITKNRTTGSSDWAVFHTSLDSGEYYAELNTTDAQAAGSSVWGDTSPSSTVITLGGANLKTNASSDQYIHYVFSEVQGYSRFSRYKGNGDTNGPFIFTGFKPAWLIIKRFDGSGYWVILDNKRNSPNPSGGRLGSNGNDAEYGNANVDFLSNGFKVRASGSDSDTNGNGTSYIYMAFAEHPFVSSEGVPVTAK